MRKREKPRSLKQLGKQLVEYCEECGNRGIRISTVRIEEGYQSPGGFFGSLGEILAPTDPDEYKDWKNDRARKPGLEVSYYCTECDMEFEQFYDEPTVITFLKAFS